MGGSKEEPRGNLFHIRGGHFGALHRGVLRELRYLHRHEAPVDSLAERALRRLISGIVLQQVHQRRGKQLVRKEQLQQLLLIPKRGISTLYKGGAKGFGVSCRYLACVNSLHRWWVGDGGREGGKYRPTTQNIKKQRFVDQYRSV